MGGEAFTWLQRIIPRPAFAEARQTNRVRYNHLMGRMVRLKPWFTSRMLRRKTGLRRTRDASSVAAVELGGMRARHVVPMLKENELVGAFILCRKKSAPLRTSRLSWSKLRGSGRHRHRERAVAQRTARENGPVGNAVRSPQSQPTTRTTRRRPSRRNRAHGQAAALPASAGG